MRALRRLTLSVVTIALLACGEETNPTPTSTFTTSTGTGTGTGGDGQGGSGGGATGTGGSGGSCEGPNGCFSCAPTETEHFLDACTDAQCSHFDNEARLPLFDRNGLPPIP